MTVEKAVNLLKQVESVEEWNNVRDSIKSKVSSDDWLEEYVPVIDCSGLIVQVLNK